jgi:hypothetical protein
LLGTYRGGKFTTADLVRWLKALPLDYTATVRQADDEQLEQFVKGLMRNEVLEQEARQAGYGLTEPDLAELQQAMAWELGQLRSAMGLDSVLAEVQDPTERLAAAAAVVDRARAAVLGRAPAHRDGVGNLNGRCRKGSGSWRPSPGITKEFRAGRKPFPSNRLRCS